MPCFYGDNFPTLPVSLGGPLVRAVLTAQKLWYCTANEISVNAECVVVFVIGGVCFLMAIYDAYNISTCMRHLVALRRHLVVLFMLTGLYSLVNSMAIFLRAESILWGGLLSFIRVYFVYHYLLYLLSILFVDGFGDYEELVEKTAKLLQTGDKPVNEAWVRGCVLKVQVWMLWTVLSYILKSACNDYLKYSILENNRVAIWKGGLIYIIGIDILFTILCGKGMSDLSLKVMPFLRPDRKLLVKCRHALFIYFYLLVSLFFPAIMNIIFVANVGVSDAQYGWWSRHSPTFVAASMLPFQCCMHRCFVPDYKWAFGRSALLRIKHALKSRDDVPAFILQLKAEGITLSVLDTNLDTNAFPTPANAEDAANAEQDVEGFSCVEI